MKPAIRYIRFNIKVLYKDYVKTIGGAILTQMKERRYNANSCNLRTLLKLRTNRAVH